MNDKPKMTISELLRNAFFILLILQLAPTIIESLSRQFGKIFVSRTKVAVVPIKGVLYDSERYCTLFRKFFTDKEIKAILIKMECPGGASGTSQIIFNEINALKKEHPKIVVTMVENVCASGGYNIACASDYIVCPGSAMIGSIGTTMPYLFNVKELLEQYKVKYTPIAAGEYKNIANPFVDMTNQEKSLLQNLANDSYDQFVLEVSASRKLPVEKAKEWANGKVFTGRQALKLGLVDQLGSLDSAIKLIKSKALIKTEIEWVHPPRKSMWAILSGDGAAEVDQPLYAYLSNVVRSFFGSQLSVVN